MYQDGEGKNCKPHYPPGVRIVVEFGEGAAPPAVVGAEKELDRCGRRFWDYLGCRFPDLEEISLRPSIREVGRDRLESLVAEARKRRPGYRGTAEKFLRHFDIVVPSDPDRIDALRDALSRWEKVRAVYLSLPAELPGLVSPTTGTGGYINPAPEGLDFRHAWSQELFDGTGLRILDLEQSYAQNHPYLPGITVIDAGTMSTSWTTTRHGTGVIGVIASQGDAAGPATDGMTGIAPRCSVHFASTSYAGNTPTTTTTNVEAALLAALASGTLGAGDVILIEEQAQNSRTGRMVPVEQKAAVFEAIRLATALGIVVVEPAGNALGWTTSEYQNLDHADNRVEGTVDGAFEPSLNRADPSFIDSGAIVVGAVRSAVVSGRHERRRDSNYGSRVDCYAWGENVPSTGINYSNQPLPRSSFLGMTSAASAIIAGAALVIQAKAKAKYGTALPPERVRELLASYGTPVIASLSAGYGYGSNLGNASTAEVVGRMPDLLQILAQV